MRKFHFDLEFVNTKEYKKGIILDFHYEHKNLFDKAAESSINSLKDEIAAAELSLIELNQKLDNISEESEAEITCTQIRDIEWDIDWNNEHIFAFNEMRIIYLFKHLEIGIKSLIQFAYPNTNTKDFYRWDNILVFFKGKGINLPGVGGYLETDQLRKLNNQLKHSGELTDELKKLPEFSGHFYGSGNLEMFYFRVKPKIIDFQKALCNAIVKELFEFDEKRLEDLSNSFYERMDKNTAQLFTTKLLNKWE